MTRMQTISRLAAAVLLGVVPLQAADFDLSWQTIDGGGGFSYGGAFELEAAIGQPDAGEMTGGDFVLTGGFLAAAPPSSGQGCPGDADGDNDVDVTDLGLLLGNYGASGPGIPGDLDGDADVDITDLGIQLAHFGTVCD